MNKLRVRILYEPVDLSAMVSAAVLTRLSLPVVLLLLLLRNTFKFDTSHVQECELYELRHIYPIRRNVIFCKSAKLKTLLSLETKIKRK